MKFYAQQVLLFCAIVATSTACVFGVYRLAHADVTFTPTSPQSPGFMTGASVSITTSQDGWLSIETPSNGGECYVGFGNGGYNWGIGTIGSVGSGGTLNTYVDGSGAHGTNCSPYGITDWTVDGNYIVRIYSDATFTTVLEEGTFFQGNAPPPPPVPLGGATSTLEQTQDNLYHSWILYYIAMFGMIWLMRKH